jgi:hypothetical protein
MEFARLLCPPRGLVPAACVFLCIAAARPVTGAAGDELFTNSVVRHLRLEISPDGLDILRQYTWRTRKETPRRDVPATLREGDQVWTNVSVHLKGAYGSFQAIDEKPGFTLNFDKLVEGQHFHGLKKISLNNSVQDATYLNDRIARELHTAAGVPTPRVDYATVELNGKHLGLYVLAEGWNKQFLKRHFNNLKGNFYDFGGSHDIDKPTPADFGEAPTNHAALNALVEATKEKDHAQRIAALRRTLDLDRFLSMTALDTLIWNWDGYANNRNNYRAFVDLDSERVVFMPHGMDMILQRPNAPIITGRAGLVVKALLETEEGRRLYLERLRELRATVFNAQVLTQRVDALSKRLAPVFIQEGLMAAVRFQTTVGYFRNRIVAREREVDAQLAGLKGLLRFDRNQTVALTNWMPGAQQGVVLDKTTDDVAALHVRANSLTELGAWLTTVWLEEGRYRVQGRVKTRGIDGGGTGTNAGAGFRIWSTRKISEGASWSWIPIGNGRNPRLAGVIPALTNTVQQRLQGDTEWKTITHEFELRQPLADLQIQCVLENAAGEAWFDVASLQIQRRSKSISRLSVPVASLDPSLKEAATATIRLGATASSQGLTQVNTLGDGRTVSTTANGDECHEIVRQPGRPAGYLYLRIDPALKATPFVQAKVQVEYFDTTNATFNLQYDSQEDIGEKQGAYAATAQRVKGSGSATWKTGTFVLENLRFEGRQNAQADFRVCVTSSNLLVRSVTLTKLIRK